MNRSRKSGPHVDAFRTVLLCGLLKALTGRGKEASKIETKAKIILDGVTFGISFSPHFNKKRTFADD